VRRVPLSISYIFAGIIVGLGLLMGSAMPAHAQNIIERLSGNKKDSVQVDSLPMLPVVQQFIHGSGRIPVAQPFAHPPKAKLIQLPLDTYQSTITLDSTGTYLIEDKVGDISIGIPRKMGFEELSERGWEESLNENWSDLSDEFNRSQQERRGLLDFKINIPGVENTAFTTIFGKPEVNLRVNGTANMNLGVSIQNTSDPSLDESQQQRVDPTFEQNLKLNITGTIGDKLSINTDWDTENPFEYQNRLSIVYEGYEDEIIKRIEMGNVSMETGNSLIRGGGALFGIKSIAELGPLKITSVLSQQEGQGNTQTITGGAEERQIQIRPTDYEDDRHFFLDFFTRQQFETNTSNPQQVGTALELVDINVWMLNESSQNIEGQRSAVALVDLGVRENGGNYLPPDQEGDQFPDALFEQFRDPGTGVSASEFGVDPAEFVEGYFIPLVEGRDYSVNRALGYISLKRNLGSRQALAISFSYRDPATGQTVYVGDINQGGSERIFLKLIRPQTVTTDNKAWPLTMRNIYSLNATNFTREDIDLDIQFTAGNVPQTSLPGRNNSLLQELGLDRVDSELQTTPDNKLDIESYVVDAGNGRLIFPYLQPFGDRLRELIQTSDLPAPQKSDALTDYVFDELYDQKQREASQQSQNNYFKFDGQVKGAVSDNYFLNVALVKGSVRVFANGVELQEGTDYEVDYSIGSVTILSQRYLQSGQEIKIEYESNQLTKIDQKSFTGIRAEYSVSDDIKFGSTLFRLKERPLQDKIRIGDEPINNTVLGVDAKADFEAPWLTQAIDFIPLLQTKEESSISLSGEWAQLRPDVAQTNAIQEAIDNNKLYKDEEQGLSFIDDFEGVETTISFTNPSRWSIAAAPAAIPGYDPDAPFFGDTPPTLPNVSLDAKIDRSDLRSQFSWYSIPTQISDVLGGVDFTPETELVKVTDVFPQKDALRQEQFIRPLDVYYDPTERGQYNYNPDIRQKLEDESEDMWGGMTTVLPSGLEDLSQNNIEFLEFWVQPVLPGGHRPTAQDLTAYEGKLYIDVGIVSEDVVPNFKLNTEDGLAEVSGGLTSDQVGRSYVPVTQNAAPDGQFSNQTRALEDIGLDGAPNENGIDGFNEGLLFQAFIDTMRQAYGPNDPRYLAIVNDPSNDDYVYYGQSELDGRPLQERFLRMYGYGEGNTPQSSDEKRASTNRPDTEGLITPSIVEQNNSYFEYEVELNPADTSQLRIGQPGTFIVDKVNGQRQSDRWYQVRIPLSEFKRRIGSIENFQNISYIRMWMSGYEKPFTLRFATFELVGSQWRKADNVSGNNDDYRVASVNIEENGSREPFPYREPEGAIRAVNRGQQQQTLANEQSIVLEVDDLPGEEIRMIKKVYPGGLNLINYSNLRMFVHGEGYQNRDDMELVVRMGTDLNNNYYEYRQPVTPSDPNFNFSRKPPKEIDDATRREEAQQVWLYEENSMNLVLSALNQLKQRRNQLQNVDYTEVLTLEDVGLDPGQVLADSPPGATIAIKGNPSLDRVSEIGLGIRNPFDGTTKKDNRLHATPSLSGQLWLNELRVSGFDNRNGWAAVAKAEVKLADFARFNANLERSTDGFGSLDSRLGDRRQYDKTAYELSSTVNMDKFIPSRYGWNIPVTLSTRRSTQTPRFLPNQGDIRLEDYKKSVRSANDLSETQKDQLIDSTVTASQTYLEGYSINFSNISKQYSKSKLAEYTLDKTSLNYVYNTTHKRNPSYVFEDNWNYSGSVNYNLNLNNVQLWQPFDGLSDSKYGKWMSGLQLGYMPNSVKASTTLNRTYDEKRPRTDPTQPLQSLRQSHTFTLKSSFGLGYNLTKSISTNFQTSTEWDLSNIGTEPIESITTGPDSARYRVRPTFDVLKDVIADTLSARRNDYQESYTANWRPRFDRIDALKWFSYTASYSGGFRWDNGPAGSSLGATVSNNLRLDQSVGLRMQDLLGMVPGYEKLKQDVEDLRRERAIKKREKKNGTGSRRDENRQDQNGDGEEKANAEKEEADIGKALANTGKEVLVALLSMDSFDISYTTNKRGQQAGYAGGSQFFHMFNSAGESNYSPPLGYRLGLQDLLPRDHLVRNRTDNNILSLPNNLNFDNNLSFQTRLSPWRNFSIDLNWSASWERSRSQSIKLDPQQNFSVVSSQNGGVSSSVWAFGSGYRDLFERQLNTAFEDLSGGYVISDSLGNNDGQTILNRDLLQQHFRKAYLGGGNSAIGKLSFMPFPMPNWRVTWSGLESAVGFLDEIITRASLNHSFSGTYRMGWDFNEDIGPLLTRSVGDYQVQDRRPQYEPTSVNLEKKFSPLVGLNITWANSLRTNVQYDYSKLTSLALTNTSITERMSQGVKLTMSYTINDFRLPIFKRIKNAVDLTLNASYLKDLETQYLLDADLSQALQGAPDQVSRDPGDYEISPREPTGQTRIQGSMIIGYRFSQTVKANFEYNYRHLIPQSTGVFERTDHDIKFNIVVSIRS
jgi:cell surface protein SprA